jgi:Protein of unknown function (DUF3179)
MHIRMGLRTMGATLVLALPLTAQQPQPNGGPFVAQHNPRFVPATQADFLKDSDRVVGLSKDGVAKAYAIRFMAFHHVIQDRLGDTPILATW